MKNIMIFTVLLFSYSFGYSQANGNSISMGNEFAMLAAHGGSQTSFSTFQSYTSNEVDGSQFFLPDWSKGEVVLNDHQVFNNGILLAYDKVRQEVFIRQTGADAILLGTKEDIHTFNIYKSGSQYHFINSSVYTKTKPEFYFQLLVADSSKLTLLKYTKGTFVKYDKNDMMQQREGNVYDKFVDKIDYYVSKGNGEPQLLQLRAKTLKKTFSNLNISIDKYLNDHTESIDEEYLIDMIGELNK